MEQPIRPPMIEYALPDTATSGRTAWREVIDKSAGVPLTIFALLVTALSLYAASGPQAYFFPLLGAFLGWIFAMGWWGIAARFALLIRASPDTPHARWEFLIAPFLLSLTIVVSAAGWPSQAGFFVARHSMERIALTQMQAPGGATLSADVIGYGSCKFTHSNNAVTIEVADASGLDLVGFVYCPVGQPAVSGRTNAIGGPWYSWYWKF
jgi:hypothetical protein